MLRVFLASSFGLMGLMAVSAPASPLKAAEIMPHRANYLLELRSAEQGSGISDVRGVMSIELVAACDGWTLQHRMRLEVQHRTGQVMEMDTDFTSWETRDGRTFQFESRSRQNGSVIEEISGRAELAGAGKGGTISYTKPEEKRLDLPAGTMFPVAHTRLVIDEAMSGKSLMWNSIFDGTSEEGGYGVSTIIGAPVSTQGVNLPPLVGSRAWPVKQAYFGPGKTQEVPEFEFASKMNDGGVTFDITLDYGSFTLDATLKQIEALPAPDC